MAESVVSKTLTIKRSVLDQINDAKAALKNWEKSDVQFRSVVNFHCTRLQNSSKLLEQSAQEWVMVIDLLNDPKTRKLEQAKFDKHIKKADNVFAVQMLAVDTICQLTAELETVSSTKQTQAAEVEASEASMDKISARLQHELHLNLPKLKIAQYHGELQKWNEFWDMYESTIHTKDMPDVLKFHYLKGLVRGSAADAIGGIPVTNSNYSQAINILKQRFGNPESIKNLLWSQLRDLKINESTVENLRQSFDKLQIILRQLETSGEDMIHPSIIHLIIPKFSKGFQGEMARYKEVGQNWSLERMTTSVLSVISQKEEIQQNSARKEPNKKKNTNKAANQGNMNPNQAIPVVHTRIWKTSTYTEIGNPRFGFCNMPSSTGRGAHKSPTQPCIFCNEMHFRDSCPNYSTWKARRNCIISQGRCTRCFKQGHTCNQCDADDKECVHCHKDGHNRALCFELFK